MTKREFCIKLQAENKKKKYVFGAGVYATIIGEYLIKYNIPFDGFCVSDAKGNRAELLGKDIVTFDCILRDYSPEELFFVIAIKGNPGKAAEKKLLSNRCDNYIFYSDEIISENVEVIDLKNRPTLEVTLKLGCNVQCRYCPQEILLKEYFKNNKARDSKMSLDTFKTCIDKMPSDTLVEFSGFAEPFLNEEAIPMMKYAESKGLEMTLYTTLVGLNRELMAQILKIPFKTFILHTADNDNYAKIPVTKEYLSMVEELVKAKKRNGIPYVDGANCQSSPNIEVLEVTKGQLRISCEMSDRAGNLDNKDGNLTGANIEGPLFCSRSNNLNHNVLLPDGTLVLCCNDFGMKHVLGNLVHQSYEEIMHSEAMREVKRAMNIDFEKDIICRKCMFAKKRVTE